MLVKEGVVIMSSSISAISDNSVLVEDIIKRSNLIVLNNGDLVKINGYSLESLDRVTCYPLVQVLTMIRYVLGQQQELLYVRNSKTNQLEKIA